MFGWLGWRRTARDGRVPSEASRYMAAIEPHLNDPFVRAHFHQVARLQLAAEGIKSAEFFAL